MDEIILVNEKKILALIFIVALALRFIAVVNLPNQYRIPAGDASEYNNLALDLLAGKGLINPDTGQPSSWRVPLYPAFLAFIYLIFGHSYFAVRIIQCIMGALLCVFIFYIAKIIFSRKIALLSAIALAFYQPYIFYNVYGGPAFLLSENLFVFLLALFLLYFIKSSVEKPGLKYGILSGILLGCATLTRPLIALFPLFLFALLLSKERRLPAAAKKLLPLLVSFILVILPWTVRNYFVNKAFVPFSTEGGFALFGGNNPYVRGGGIGRLDVLLTEEENRRFSAMSEVQRDKEFRRLGKEFLFKNYKKLPKIFFKKLLVLWDIYETDQSNGRRIYNIWYGIILMFSLPGIIKVIRSKLNIVTITPIMIFVYFSIIAMIFAGDPRFRYPVEPYLIIFASMGFFTIYNKFKNKFFSYTVISCVITVNFLFYRYSDVVLNWMRSVLHYVAI